MPEIHPDPKITENYDTVEDTDQKIMQVFSKQILSEGKCFTAFMLQKNDRSAFLAPPFPIPRIIEGSRAIPWHTKYRVLEQQWKCYQRMELRLVSQCLPPPPNPRFTMMRWCMVVRQCGVPD